MEQRASRVRVNKVGRVIGSDSNYIEACVILDVSDSGALLLVDGKPPPDRCQILQRSSRVLRPAEVVRRGPAAVAVRFTAAGETLSVDDVRLKRWLE